MGARQRRDWAPRLRLAPARRHGGGCGGSDRRLGTVARPPRVGSPGLRLGWRHARLRPVPRAAGGAQWVAGHIGGVGDTALHTRSPVSPCVARCRGHHNRRHPPSQTLAQAPRGLTRPYHRRRSAARFQAQPACGSTRSSRCSSSLPPRSSCWLARSATLPRPRPSCRIPPVGLADRPPRVGGKRGPPGRRRRRQEHHRPLAADHALAGMTSLGRLPGSGTVAAGKIYAITPVAEPAAIVLGLLDVVLVVCTCRQSCRNVIDHCRNLDVEFVMASSRQSWFKKHSKPE